MNMKDQAEERVRLLLEFLIIFIFLSTIVLAILVYKVMGEIETYAISSKMPVVIEKERIVEVEVEVPVEVPVEVNSNPITSKEPNYIINVTDEEIELMKRVVMSESSICDFDVKCAVAATIVNRVLSEDFPDTVTQVVYTQNAYSTQNNGDPDDDCERAVMYALKYQVFPTSMYYFRTGEYHSFGNPLMKMGTMYFSTK